MSTSPNLSIQPTQTDYPQQLPIDDLSVLVIDQLLDWFRSHTSVPERIDATDALQARLWDEYTATTRDTHDTETSTTHLRFESNTEWRTFETAIRAFNQLHSDSPLHKTTDNLLQRPEFTLNN